MTTVSTFSGFLEELNRLMESKENPDEWYVVSGKQVGEYSIHTAEKPDEIPEDQSELPPEARDATENVGGFYQIGSSGWSEKAFDDEVRFVSEAGFSRSHDEIDRRINNLLLVHESALSQEALEVAGDKEREAAEA